MSAQISQLLANFAHEKEIEGLSQTSLMAIVNGNNGYTLGKAHQFLAFQNRINQELLQHRIITENQYTSWFKKGEQSSDQIRAFIIQFSLFSNRFLVAQLLKMINAETLEEMRASKEILANEIGVVFKSKHRDSKSALKAVTDYDPELVSCEGSVEGGVFHFRAGHFEWLLNIASELGLKFSDLGRTHHGTESTIHFCKELARLYGSEKYSISQAASYAVENWAAAGFWDELVEGFNKFNLHTGAGLPLSFFTWHSRLEAQHASHTQEELELLYFKNTIDEDAFIHIGQEMLDGVAVFWNGLESQRKQITSYTRSR